MIRHGSPNRSVCAVLAIISAVLAFTAPPGLALAMSPGVVDRPALAQGPIAPAGLDTRQWMAQTKEVIGDRPLNRIVMPGSHDAGSWSITDKSGVCDTASEAKLAKDFPPIAATISVTQSASIKNQLDDGSRYLDLRLCKQNGKWYTYHGGPLGGLFFDDPATGARGEADTISDWLRDHPTEIVTIELRTSVPAATAAADNAEAVELLGRTIGTARMADRSALAPSSTYNQFMAAGDNVVLIDDQNATAHPWAWPSSRIDGRGTYVENKDWGSLVAEVLKNPLAKHPAIDVISRTAIERDEQVLTTDTGDPQTLFALSGNVDSTLAIPAATLQVITHGMNYRPNGLPYMLYLAREHNVRLLQKLEGTWRTSLIAKNSNIVAVDYIDMSAQRADGSAISPGDMSRAIIANNTPTTAPGTLVATERLAQGGWTAAEALPGAWGALEFAGSQGVVAAMPNGDLQFLAYGIDKHLYHNIRFASGSWQGWNRLDDDATDKQLDGGRLAVTSTPDGTLHALAVDKAGDLLHTLRRPDGFWQSGGWARVPGNGSQGMKAKAVSATGLPDGSVKVLAYDQDGALRITRRAADGSWDVSGWRTVPGPDGVKAFTGSDLSVTSTPDSGLRIAAVGQDGNVYSMAQDANGVSSGWTRLDRVKGQPMQATAVSVAALPDGTAQVLAVGLDGNTWHAAWTASAGWTSFGAVAGPWNRPLAATYARLVSSGNGRTYTLVGAR
ncbi:hypothetical protein [Streptomyces sp. NPDC051014]|uniref:hypothetical protein n=1 Tax=Streptomyces sp. NPDC051014 TaxID=3155751 RepID=UPI0033E05613